MRLILVGPSHIPRIQHALEKVGLPKPVPEIVYLGDGGFPIWKKSVFDQCCKIYQEGDRILLIAADFRFGNSIIDNPPHNLESHNFFDGFTHVKRELCTAENDVALKQLCLRSLNEWKSTFGKSLTILHWTLAMRTVKNRISKQHVNENGIYSHPIWNICDADFATEVAGLANLQHSGDLSTCEKLTIDNDLHPSTLGYLYINAIAANYDHEQSLNKAKSIYMAGVNKLTSELVNKSKSKCLFFGTSKLLQTILSALPINSRKTLSKVGLEFLQPGEQPDSLLAANYDKLVYFSGAVLDSSLSLSNSIKAIKEEFSALHNNVQVLHWETLTTQVLQWRARNQRGAGTGLIEKNFASETYHEFWPKEFAEYSFDTIDRLVEFGAGGSCTFWGILAILTASVDCRTSKLAESVLVSMHQAAKQLHMDLAR